jgi:hypothetical protein
VRADAGVHGCEDYPFMPRLGTVDEIPGAGHERCLVGGEETGCFSTELAMGHLLQGRRIRNALELFLATTVAG